MLTIPCWTTSPASRRIGPKPTSRIPAAAHERNFELWAAAPKENKSGEDGLLSRRKDEMSDPDVLTLPADALALLQDPRLEGMEDPPPRMPREERLLKPATAPLVGESPFLLLQQSFVT